MFALSVAFVPSVFMQQGGPYTIKQSVIAGGGGASANAGTKVEGTIGQGVLGLSSGGAFSLNAGFWQAGAACAAAGIASQPINQTVCAGSPASFSVSTNGSVSGYQWGKNGVDLTNAGNMSGVQSPTLIINPANAADADSYDCVVSGSCSAPVTSNAVTLIVNIYLLSSMDQSFSSSGGNGSVNVTTAASCPWTAVSNAPWIGVTNGPGGVGNGQVTYTVAANPGGGRTGTMTIAGQTFTVSQDAPTIVTLVSLEATAYPDGVMIEWRTGLEVDNLGFNLYRDEGGKPTRINTQLVVGSALKFGHGIAIGSGCSYKWWDEKPASESTAYWLEDVDLNGQSVWRGPFGAAAAAGKQRPLSVEKARSLAALSIFEAPSTEVETRAALASSSRVGLSPAGKAQSIIASTGGGVKLQVKREGWYRATAAELIEAGLNPAVDPRNLQLFVDGVQQAIKLNGEDDGRLDSADSVEFYGAGLDSPFSDLRTYYLVAGKQAGLRIANIQGSAHPSLSGSFRCTVERRDRTIYFSALRNGEKENFFGAVVAGQAVNQSITVSHIAGSSEPATLEIALQGVTYAPHIVTVQLNGEDVGQFAFEGQAEGVSRLQVAPSLLREGINQVSLVARGGPLDVNLVDYIRLTYQHSFTADQDKLKLTISGGRQVTIGGFTSESIRVFDVTDPLGLQEISGYVQKDETGYGVSLMAAGAGQRTLLALTNDNVNHVARIVRDYSSSLTNPGQGADLLIITLRELFDSARELAVLRQKEGLSVGLVDIEDIYDEFSYGQKTPGAVKDFLAVARTSWKKPVRYVLVLGDASYDPKNYLGLGDFDLVPTRLIDSTFMESASDDWLTDFDGDCIADIPIGRLPVRNATEGASIIAKIVNYEQSSPAEEALLVSDLNDGINFEGSSEQLIPLIPSQTKVTHIKRGQLGDQATHAALMDLIDRGQRIVNYNGHGNLDMWRGVFSAADANELTNEKRLAMFVMMDCLNGYFQDPATDSLGEALLKSPGGAVAVWASSAMTYAEAQAPMTARFYRQVFGGSHVRLGDAAMRAKAATADVDVRRSWVLLGDPTMRLK
jgi:hypothetical protein